MPLFTPESQTLQVAGPHSIQGFFLYPPVLTATHPVYCSGEEAILAGKPAGLLVISHYLCSMDKPTFYPSEFHFPHLQSGHSARSDFCFGLFCRGTEMMFMELSLSCRCCPNACAWTKPPVIPKGGFWHINPGNIYLREGETLWLRQPKLAKKQQKVLRGRNGSSADFTRISNSCNPLQGQQVGGLALAVLRGWLPSLRRVPMQSYRCTLEARPQLQPPRCQRIPGTFHGIYFLFT